MMRFILCIFLILASFSANSQFELKAGISGSQFESQVGGQIEAAYVSSDFITIGLFGSYGKVLSDLDKHHILATGLVMEVRGRFNEEMKVIPLLNFHLGRSWEYRKLYYKYGDNNQYTNDINKHITGFAIAARTGIISNFSTTGRFQFQFDIGLLMRSIAPFGPVFSVEEPIGFLEARLLLVYSL